MPVKSANLRRTSTWFRFWCFSWFSRTFACFAIFFWTFWWFRFCWWLRFLFVSSCCNRITSFFLFKFPCFKWIVTDKIFSYIIPFVSWYWFNYFKNRILRNRNLKVEIIFFCIENKWCAWIVFFGLDVFTKNNEKFWIGIILKWCLI